MTPGLPKGRTAVRIISQRVAPNARAPSLWVTGVWSKTSRDSAVTIGSTMIDRTMPMKKMVPPLIPVERRTAGTSPGRPGPALDRRDEAAERQRRPGHGRWTARRRGEVEEAAGRLGKLGAVLGDEQGDGDAERHR